MREMIRLEKVNKMFGDLHVLKDVNLTVAEGGKVFIAGQQMTHKNKRQLVRDNMSMVFPQSLSHRHRSAQRSG